MLTTAAEQNNRTNYPGWLLLGLCLPLLVWQTLPDQQVEMPRNIFLSAHSLLEIISIAAAALVFFIAFGARDTQRSTRVVILGCLFLAAALFDALHLLSYPGMPDLISANSTDKMIWFWLAARYCAALGLMVYVLCPGDRIAGSQRRGTLLAATVTLFVVISIIILYQESSLPLMYIPGEGLTTLKIVLEWLVVAMLLLAAFMLYRHRQRPGDYDTGTLILAMLLMAAGELFFTVYVQVSSTANLLGHVYKVIAYYYLYRAIFTETVRRPFLRIAQLNSEVVQERDLANGMLDTAPSIILLLDPQGMIRHVNPWFEQLTGYRRDEVVGKEWFATFLPARDQARIRELFASALHDQPVRGNINPIVTRDGEERAIEWHSMPLRDADGQMTGLLSIGVDVTERQQLERELLRSETLLNSVIQQIPAMVFLKDASDLRFELLNRAGEELLGLEQTALLGKSDHDLFPLEQASAFVDKDQEVLASGQTLDIPEEAILVRNGETRILHTRKVGIYDAAGEPTHLLGISFDITEQKRTQEMMEFLARASSASEPDAFLRLCVRKLAEFYGARYAFIGLLNDSRQDVQTLAVWAGEDFAPNFEYNLVGTPCRDVLDLQQELIPHEAARLYPDDAMLVEMGVDSYYGAPLISSSGRTVGVLSVMDTQAMEPTPWTAPLLGVFASRMAMELERKEAIDSLRELNTSLEQRVADRTAELERANAAKNEFLSRMSHELRTPLNAILGFTQVLQLPGKETLNEQQASNVREIHHAGEHLLGLVNEVLDLARIESGRLEISLGPVAMQPAIERCAAQIKIMAQKRGIHLTQHVHQPCTVLADPARLTQVLLNLLSNAVKYNREGGRIDIECVLATQQRVRVTVRDTGPGLSVGQQSRLFRPFERLESAYQGIEGTGIGLALAKQLVEGMQGTIGVDSLPGEGSSFWFELQLCEQTLEVESELESLASTGIDAPAIQGKLHTVLYIEDNPANLRLVKRILDRYPAIELLVAENAEDGLVLAGREQPDLILLDLNLPGMDGFEALQCLRAAPATHAIPVIAVTANAMPRDIERGRAAGFQDYIIKPINIQVFLLAITSHLDLPQVEK